MIQRITKYQNNKVLSFSQKYDFFERALQELPRAARQSKVLPDQIDISIKNLEQLPEIRIPNDEVIDNYFKNLLKQDKPELNNDTNWLWWNLLLIPILPVPFKKKKHNKEVNYEINK